MNSRIEQMRINLENGLDCLMVETAELTRVCSGFTSATISSGRSRSEYLRSVRNPLTAPTTSNSDLPRKRCVITWERAGELTTRILTLRKSCPPCQRKVYK